MATISSPGQPQQPQHQQLIPGYVWEFSSSEGEFAVVLADNLQAAKKELSDIVDDDAKTRFKFRRCVAAKIYPFVSGVKP